MSEETPENSQIDRAALHHLVDRIVASNLTTAIYTRQTQEEYDEEDFDDVARDVVREVINTYSALLGVFQNNPETEDNSGNGR